MTVPVKASGAGLRRSGEAFLAWLDEWQSGLRPFDLGGFMQDEGILAEQVAVVSADLVDGFCYVGPLSSPRVAGIVPASVDLFERAYELGVRQFVLLQEYHTHDAPEFDQFGPHCVRGTEEAWTIEPLKSLPFSSLFRIVHKNSLHPALGTDFDAWLAERPELSTFLTVGDCTDLCVYQLVMHLKLGANAAGRKVNVIVPANCVQTYDLPVDVAESIGALPHPGDILHALFLYHMALNGARVVGSLS